MADPAIRRSALDGIIVAGTFGAAADDGTPGVTITERRPLTLVHVSVRDGDRDTITAVNGAAGVALPETSGMAAVSSNVRALWLAPGRWLLSSETTNNLAGDISGAAPGAAINDVSSGRTVLRLAGPHTRDVLASDCPLDLHPSAFGTGHAAVGLIGHFNVVIDCIDEEVFDVYVARGFAADFWHWLTEAAAEWGYRVDA